MYWPQNRYDSLGRKIIFANREEIEACYLDYVRRQSEASKVIFKDKSEIEQCFNNYQERKSAAIEKKREIAKQEANSFFKKPHGTTSTNHHLFDNAIAKAKQEGRKTINFHDLASALREAA